MNTAAKKGPDKPTVIKKYANRRLYDTGRSSYVTLDDLCIMVKEGHDFVVFDAKTGEDLTRSVLTQIIVDQEGKEGQQNLLPISFLRQLIGFYGDSLQGLVPNYLEQTIDSFSKNQEYFRDQMTKSMSGVFTNPVSAFEELNRKNMEMFQTAMRAWAPLAQNMTSAATKAATSAAQNAETRARELKKNIADLQSELNKISEPGSGDE